MDAVDLHWAGGRRWPCRCDRGLRPGHRQRRGVREWGARGKEHAGAAPGRRRARTAWPVKGGPHMRHSDRLERCPPQRERAVGDLLEGDHVGLATSKYRRLLGETRAAPGHVPGHDSHRASLGLRRHCSGQSISRVGMSWCGTSRAMARSARSGVSVAAEAHSACSSIPSEPVVPTRTQDQHARLQSQQGGAAHRLEGSIPSPPRP